MKNIFEDSNNKNNSENTGDVNRSQEAAPQPNTADQAQIHLTTEQLSALIAQILSTQLPQQQSAPVQPAVPAQSDKPMTAADQNSSKRIIYQSEDFDDPQDEGIDIIDGSEEENGKKFGFYSDDSKFRLDAARQRSMKGEDDDSLRTHIKTTDFGDNFSIDEIDLKGNELPQIRQEEPQEQPENVPLLVQSSEVNLPTQISPEATYVPSIQVEEIEVPQDNSQKKKSKKLPTSEIIRRCVLAVSIAAIIISAGVLIKEFVLHKQNQSLEEDVQNLIVDVSQPVKEKDKDKDTSDKSESTLSLDQQWAQIRQDYPNVIFPPGIQLKYAKLYAENQEFVGYLSAKGIGLSLPIVQAQDDEKYLTKNFYGQNTKYGCPFVTHVNNIKDLDLNTVIFGHHMNDGTVFGALDEYKTIDGFKKAPVITFNTIYKDYKWKVIAAFLTNAYEKDDNGYVFKYYFASLSEQDRFTSYINELAQRTYYNTGVDVLPTDKLLTLSTCSHEFDEARFVVVARLVRPGESADVDTNLASVNPNPRYPQAYYTKNKLTNPYANFPRWEIG